METWAAVRPTSSRKYLQDERIHFINLNLSSEEELEKELAPHEFDYIVHAAGATKCLHAEDFYKVNTEGTKHLVNVLLRLQMPIRRFVSQSPKELLIAPKWGLKNYEFTNLLNNRLKSLQ